MGWKEKIENYQEQKREALDKEKEEENRRKEKLEKQVVKLGGIVKKLGLKEMLTQIRDEVWQVGDIGEIAETPDFLVDGRREIVKAGVELKASWPKFCEGYDDEDMYDNSYWVDATTETIIKRLAIVVSQNEDENDNFGISIQTEQHSFQGTLLCDYDKFILSTNEQNLNREDSIKKIEETLIRDGLVSRGLSYLKEKEAAEKEIIEMIGQGQLNPEYYPKK